MQPAKQAAGCHCNGIQRPSPISRLSFERKDEEEDLTWLLRNYFPILTVILHPPVFVKSNSANNTDYSGDVDKINDPFREWEFQLIQSVAEHRIWWYSERNHGRKLSSSP
ncbi:hypothetical protein CEXT_4491 [Caerostris extrusa]|uniref:Ycf15 n=1 Tax=Caerostris extrusa TaxID=172846 RepID=A0AAV4N0H2_CAEEX|nr:hypothetical protein CEXT_4491 [Caerostris extrusa]